MAGRLEFQVSRTGASNSQRPGDDIREMLKNDRPILKSSDDKFNRKNFAEIIARSIRSCSESSSSSFVFGISGEWGSGKTSTINLVKEVLGEEDKKSFKIIEFSPLFFQGSQGLIYEFLTQFAIALNGTGKPLKDTNSKVMELAQILKPLEYIPGVGKVFGAILNATKSFNQFLHKNKRTVEEIKKNISEKIKNKGIKFLIIMDDMDRLPEKETVLMLMIIRYIANFDNTYYLLAYDQTLLSRICDSIQKDHGEEFTKKIVQFSFQLPSFPKQELANMFWRELNDVINFDELKMSQRERLEHRGRKYIEDSLSNPRDIIRLMNTYTLSLNNAKQQLDIIDLLYLSFIEVLGYELYVHIRNNRSIYTGERMTYLSKDERERYKRSIKLDIDDITSKLDWFGPTSKKLLSILFPDIREYLLGDKAIRLEDEDVMSLRLDWRLAAPECFESYFSLPIPPETIGRLEMETIIQASLKETEIENLFNSFKDKASLYHLYRSLEDLTKKPDFKLSVEQIKNLSYMLIKASKEVTISEEILYEPLDAAAQIIENIISNLDFEENKREIVDYIFDKTKQANGELINSLLKVLTFLFTGYIALFPQETTREYVKKLVDLYEGKLDVNILVKSENSIPILLNWQLWSNKDKHFNAFLEKLTDNKYCLVELIDSSALKTLRSMQPYIQYSISRECFERLGLIDFIYSNALDLLNVAKENKEQLQHPLEVENFLETCLQ